MGRVREGLGPAWEKQGTEATHLLATRADGMGWTAEQGKAQRAEESFGMEDHSGDEEEKATLIFQW